MIFKPLQYDSGKTKDLALAYGETVAKGDPLMFDGGYVKKADATETNAVRYVALEGDTCTATGDTILAVETRGVEFEAQCTANSAQSQVGTITNLSSVAGSTGKVSNSTATGNIFLITQTVGPAADKLVRGYFLDRVNV